MPKTITLTDGHAEAILGFATTADQFNEAMNSVRKQLRQSDQGLRLIVLQEKYLPEYKFANRIFVVNPENGIFPFKAQSETDITSIKSGYAFAPNEQLAKTIVEIRQGKYRPTKEDIRGNVPFYRWDSKENEIPNSNETIEDGDSIVSAASKDYLYFFTKEQRATFIASIEKAKGETADKFFIMQSASEEFNKLLTWARSQGYKG